MFDLDKWQEILYTINKNKMRTALTALGVAWGIFMLVLLMGAGKGMQNGIEKDFGDENVKSVWLWDGRTSMPYKGLKPGRSIYFSSQDMVALERDVPGVAYVGVRNRLSGEYTINYKDRNAAFQVYGANPFFFAINGERFVKGRSLHSQDLSEYRKVAVIGERTRSVIFGDSTEAIGQYIDIKGVYFKVVGIFTLQGGDGRREERVYIPYTTYQRVFNPNNKIELLGVGIREGYASEQVAEEIRAVLAQRHNFDVADKQAVGINNNEEQYQQLQGLFWGIRTFVWIVGIGTLMAGIVGVSNIMLIVVKERTREIGVRKAIGATPWSVVSLILMESVLITGLSGYFGMLAGVGIIDLMRWLIDSTGAEMPFFHNPEVNLDVALGAISLLVIAGALAGLVPALHAANVKPIEALRAD
ncbi:ABC transporter permease [Eisenibacter elegans]|jgi:putative ABC transport system permease protein|uniref:ABC transporter permease n=1 Tax=Eisenibacter elegans TaxID=997 RepID=UPI0004013FC0|nr:ABC transporter permease [Eisenibacter elegans]